MPLPSGKEGGMSYRRIDLNNLPYVKAVTGTGSVIKDCNDRTLATGLYPTDPAITLNMPEKRSGSMLFHIKFNVEAIEQLFFTRDTALIFHRIYIYTYTENPRREWTEWKRIAHLSDIPTIDQIREALSA